MWHQRENNKNKNLYKNLHEFGFSVKSTHSLLETTHSLLETTLRIHNLQYTSHKIYTTTLLTYIHIRKDIYTYIHIYICSNSRTNISTYRKISPLLTTFWTYNTHISFLGICFKLKSLLKPICYACLERAWPLWLCVHVCVWVYQYVVAVGVRSHFTQMRM